MPSYISDSVKKIFAEQFANLHDTFARDIVVYKEAKKVIINTDPNYNYIYNNTGGSTSIQNVPQKFIFKARILYNTNRDAQYFGSAKTPGSGEVRIKLKKEDYNQIKDVKRIELDDRMFIVDSDPRAHGLFEVDFYTLYLKPVEAQ